MTSIDYREWSFDVDILATSSTYRRVPLSGAQDCGCTECQNYIDNRGRVFPAEVSHFFSLVGIDQSKEVEVTCFQENADGRRLIDGWFHFVGSIIKGERFAKASGNGYNTVLTPISPGFSIGFDARADLTFFDTELPLVQVEFMSTIPWTLATKM